MPRFRKRPVVVEAVQFDGTARSIDRLIDWSDGAVVCADGPPQIHTAEGTLYISDGDWIIRGVQGEFYPCKPDIFEQTYELVAEVGEREEDAPQEPDGKRLVYFLQGEADVMAHLANVIEARGKDIRLELRDGQYRAKFEDGPMDYFVEQLREAIAAGLPTDG